jgi:hypothetical protein
MYWLSSASELQRWRSTTRRRKILIRLLLLTSCRRLSPLHRLVDGNFPRPCAGGFLDFPGRHDLRRVLIWGCRVGASDRRGAEAGAGAFCVAPVTLMSVVSRNSPDRAADAAQIFRLGAPLDFQPSGASNRRKSRMNFLWIAMPKYSRAAARSSSRDDFPPSSNTLST